MRSTDKPIIVEQVFNVSIDTLWQAITQHGQMKKWFFEKIEFFNPEVGFRTKFAVHVEDRIYTHLWEVTEVLPNQRIVYNWKYEEFPGASFVTFDLIEQGEMAKLKVVHEVLASFPDDIPEFTRESGLQGWNYFIKKSLKEYLETRKSVNMSG